MDKLDILNRDKFVDQLIKLIENISINKTSTCFAINGVWGSGKSFVLDMFEKKLIKIQLEETVTDKYFVVRYNSWKYDYYDEPLIAIVSVIISEIEEKTKLFPNSEEKQKIIGMFKSTCAPLFSIANTMIKEKIGVDILDSYSKITQGEKEGAEKYEKEHEYDTYLGLNKVIDKLSQLIQDIAKKCTVVIIVDELDRCLPEYAIKVLERLHHLTEGNENVITVVSIDKKQVETSVRHAFGYDNPEKYLEKFFDFEVRLDKGKTSERILEKYIDYTKLFDREIFLFDDSVEECIQEIFKDIDIRTQEQLVKKVMLVHKLLYTDKKDYSFMCMELLLAVMIFVYNDGLEFLEKTVDIDDFENIFTASEGKSKPAFSDFFQEKFNQIYFNSGIFQFSFDEQESYVDEQNSYNLPNEASLYGAIAFTWCWMHKSKNAIITHTTGDVYEVISRNHEELSKFVETINMMR